MQARALVVTGPNAIAQQTVTVRDPGPQEVLVEVLYTCISPGTELRCLRGLQPNTIHPFIPGYASVGRVVANGPSSSLALGTLVMGSGTRHAEGLQLMWGGHCSHALALERDLLRVPDGVDPLEAVLVKLGSIAYHGMRVSMPRPGEQVAVLGLGPIGQLAALMHGLSGARVVGYDRSQERLQSAQAVGIEVTPAAATPFEAFAQVMPGGADIVVDATGSIHAIPGGIQVAKELPWGDEHAKGARYLVQGSYADGFTVPYDPAFCKELTFLLPRDALASDRAAVMTCLARRQLRLRPLISAIRDPADAAAAYTQLAHDPTLVTLAFRWHA